MSVIGSGVIEKFSTAVAAPIGPVTIEIRDPATVPNQILEVFVSGGDVSIQLKTDGSGNLMSTTNDIVTAVNGHTEASALMTATEESAPFAIVGPLSKTELDPSYTHTTAWSGSQITFTKV